MRVSNNALTINQTERGHPRRAVKFLCALRFRDADAEIKLMLAHHGAHQFQLFAEGISRPAISKVVARQRDYLKAVHATLGAIRKMVTEPQPAQ